MILKKLIESKPKIVPDKELKDDEAAFAQAVKDLDYKFEGLRNDTIKTLRNMFIADMEPENVEAEDFLDWFYLSGNSFLEFVCDNYDLIPLTPGRQAKNELPVSVIRDLAENEDLFAKALRDVAMKWKIIDDSGKDLTIADKEVILSTGELVETLFLDCCSKGVPGTEDKTVRDRELLKDLAKALLETQGLVNESLDEAVEEVPEEAPVEEPQMEEVPIEQPVIEEPKPEIKENAFADMINSAIQKQWEIISDINGLIATFDFEYTEDNKEDINVILNQLLDDNTINVGMLHKVLELVSSKTLTLLDAGEEKAEEVISEPAKDLE